MSLDFSRIDMRETSCKLYIPRGQVKFSEALNSLILLLFGIVHVYILSDASTTIEAKSSRFSEACLWSFFYCPLFSSSVFLLTLFLSLASTILAFSLFF